MPVYIISGRCNCPKLAHCELAASRLCRRYPNVFVKFDMRDPEECKSHFQRLKAKFGFTDWDGTDEYPVVFTPEGDFIGNHLDFLELLEKKYKMDDVEVDWRDVSKTAQSDFATFLLRLARLNEARFRQEVLERQILGPGIVKEVEMRTEKLLQLCESHQLPRHVETHNDKARQTWGQHKGSGFDGSSRNARAAKNQDQLPYQFAFPKGRFRVSPDLSVTEAIHNGVHFVVWLSAQLRRSNIVNMFLRRNFQFVHPDFLLDKMLPRQGSEKSRTHYAMVADTPIVPNHFVAIPKQYILPVTDAKAAMCLRMRRNLILFYEDDQRTELAPTISQLAQSLEMSILTVEPEPFQATGAIVVPAKAADLESKNSLKHLLARMTESGCIFDNFPSSLEQCRALSDLCGEPQACVTLLQGETRETTVDQYSRFFDCPKKVFTIKKGVDPEQFVSDVKLFAARAMEDASSGKPPPGSGLEALPVRLYKRCARDHSEGLTRDDWRVIENILHQHDCAATFQCLPDRWPDHRRPVDTHIQMLSLPLSIWEAQTGKSILRFPLERQIEASLSKNETMVQVFDFLHALVPVKLESEATESLTKDAASPNEFEVAFSNALQILRNRSSVHLELGLSGFSLLATRKFLLLIPHNTPQVDHPAGCDPLTHGIWAKWPVPHPVAYLGGPIICPKFNPQWSEHNDRPSGERPIAYAASVDVDPDQLEFSFAVEKARTLEGCSEQSVKPMQQICIHDEAYTRPLDILKLFCLRTGKNTISGARPSTGKEPPSLK